MPLRGSALWDLRSGGSVSTEALITPTPGILLCPNTPERVLAIVGRMRNDWIKVVEINTRAWQDCLKDLWRRSHHGRGRPRRVCLAEDKENSE